MTEKLQNLIAASEDWLMQRILDYAIEHQYAQYTSTLKEPWRLSIRGLSEPMLAALEQGCASLELTPDEDISQDPIAGFGILEAQRHRERGINLAMFLGLFKYYRQAYIDLLDTTEFEPAEKAAYTTFINRSFDRIEIGFCSEWSKTGKSARVRELQHKNRLMTNEKNKYLTLFESLANPVIVLDQNHCIENINHSAARLLHTTSNRYYSILPSGSAADLAASPIGQPVNQVMPWIAPELDRFLSQKDAYLECETSVETADGPKYYQVKLSAMMDISGKFNSLLIILNDQTELKQAEERARQARDAAESANRAKSEFLASMSHELRTPLNAILGFAQLMTSSPNTTLDQQESLGIISRSGQHLLNLINQVLDFSKIESGRMGTNLRTLDLFALLAELQDTFRLHAMNKELDLLVGLHGNVPQFVKTDDIKLRQVLINLLSNAIKFTRQGSVSLRVDSESPPDTNGDNHIPVKLRFVIEDTGVGIAPEELQTIFDAFVQTQAGRESQEGTGLGMAISQKFIQLMGGDISISSQVGQGTRVAFNIEAQAATPPHPPVQPDRNRRVSGLKSGQPAYRVLVADDMLDNRLLLEKLLVPVGFEVAKAANGQEAVEIWQAWQPHLTLMDIRMPVMNGYMATQQIKQLAGQQGAKIIAVSASVLDEERAVTLNVGCDDFLRKPFKDIDLFAVLEKHLNVQYNFEEIAEGSVLAISPLQLQPEQEFEIRQCLNRQPAAWQTQFLNAVETIDLETTRASVDDLMETDPSVAATLNSYVKNFRFDLLQTLAKQQDPV